MNQEIHKAVSMQITHTDHEYAPSFALIILTAIFLLLGAVCFLVIVADIHFAPRMAKYDENHDCEPALFYFAAS